MRKKLVVSEEDSTDDHVEQLRSRRRASRRRAQEEEDTEEDYSPPPKRSKGKKILKGGRKWNEEGEITYSTPWPNQEVVNLATGKHPDPEELTFSEFLYGYVVVSTKADSAERPHRDAILLEILQDSQKYTWEAIRSAHFTLLEKIEHETCTWSDVHVRQELRRMLIWDHRLEGPVAAVAAPAAGPRAVRQPAKSKTHCSFCFAKHSKKFYHTLADCRTKKAASLAGN